MNSLHIKNDTAVTNDAAHLLIQSGTTATVNDGGVLGLGALKTSAAPIANATIKGGVEAAETYNGYLAFGVRNGANYAINREMMRITSAGNVGIGTTSPQSMLHVQAAGTALPSFAAGIAGVFARTSASSAVANLAIVSGTASASSLYFADTDSENPGYIQYNHATDYMRMIVNAGERMRIDAADNVGIGTNSMDGQLNVAANGAVIPVMATFDTNATAGSDAAIRFWRNGAAVGTITTTLTGTAFNTTSDRRLKEHIAPSHEGIETLMRIQVRDFNFTADPHKTKVQGFIAQELSELYPEAVTPGGSDPATDAWKVDYGRLTPLLVKAVQELKADNDNLRAQLKAANDNQAEAIYELRREIHALKFAH